MEKIGAISYWTVNDLKGELGVGTGAAVLTAAKKAGVGRMILGQWLFTQKDIKALQARPHRGRPVGTTGAYGPRKATVEKAFGLSEPANVPVVPETVDPTIDGLTEAVFY
jgi:hypothetical protein